MTSFLSFCAGLLAFLAVFAWSTAVFPDTTVVVTLSEVTMRPSTRPGAVAEIVFRNIPTNGSTDNGTYSLADNGIAVTFSFTWNSGGPGGSDGLIFEVPAPYVCVPSCTLEVAEGNTGAIWLYLLDGVGL